MVGLTLKERILYSVICDESRVYQYWYTRFLLAGVDLARVRRVVGRIRRWPDWCRKWFEAGCRLEHTAEAALAKGDTQFTRRWFHEAAGCFQVGQHFFSFDDDLKAHSLQKLWSIYPRALALHDEGARPLRVDIAFWNVLIPGRLRLQPAPARPLVMRINGLMT